MAEAKNLHVVGDRIEPLLDEIRSMVSPLAWGRVEAVMSATVELYGEGLRRIVDVVARAKVGADEIRGRLLADELVESLLLLHGLHPEGLAERVAHALERVRPYLGSHGGGIEVLSADDRSGEVRLRLAGSCDGCPSSLLTVKLAVEGAIRDLAPEVTHIEVEGIVGAATPPSGGASSGRDGGEPAWTPLGVHAEPAPGKLASTEVPGARVVLCRVGANLYAYRDRCPACESPIDAGELSGDLLTCPACAERYDVRLAGRSIRNREVHLDPLPLLQDDRGVRIAVGSLA